jgi:hypothetical protein
MPNKEKGQKKNRIAARLAMTLPRPFFFFFFTVRRLAGQGENPQCCYLNPSGFFLASLCCPQQNGSGRTETASQCSLTGSELADFGLSSAGATVVTVSINDEKLDWGCFVPLRHCQFRQGQGLLLWPFLC